MTQRPFAIYGVVRVGSFRVRVCSRHRRGTRVDEPKRAWCELFKKSGYRGSRVMKALRVNDAVVDDVCGHSAHFVRCGVRDIVVVVD